MYIISKNYPNNYPNNLDCSWTLKARSGYKIELTVDDFNLGYSHHSCVDYLDVFTTTNGQDYQVGRYCNGKYPKSPTIYDGNILKLVFHSSYTNSHKGFKISYASKKPGK